MSKKCDAVAPGGESRCVNSGNHPDHSTLENGRFVTWPNLDYKPLKSLSDLQEIAKKIK